MRVYRVAARMERLGDLQGGNCTLDGRLRIEVTGRDEKTAHLRFQLSALKFEQFCDSPSLRQIMWMQLSGVPLEIMFEPAAGNIAISNFASVRESLFQSLATSTQWFGRSIAPALREHITQQLKTVFSADAKSISAATGFMIAIVNPVGAEWDTDDIDAIPVKLPSPFGGDPLSATVTIVTRMFTPTSRDFTRTVVARYDQNEYEVALAQMVKKLAAGKATEQEIKSLDRNQVEAGSTSTERIEHATGWVIESEAKGTSRLNEGTQIELVRMIYMPHVK